MSRTVIAAATLSLLLSATAHAQNTAPEATAVQPLPQPADAATRADYERADALSRSIFWAGAYTINPMDPVAGVKLSQALREMGQYDQAATTAEGVLTVQPNNIDAMLEVGRAHIARGQAFYGISALERARDANPRDWRPLSLLGVAYQQVRRYEDAQAAWHHALTLSPDNPDILTNAAMALTTSGDAAAAEALLRRAVVQPGATAKTQLNLALVLGLQDRMAEAEQIIRRAMPPEVADQNLRWLRERAPQQTAAVGPDASSPSLGRTWTSLQEH